MAPSRPTRAAAALASLVPVLLLVASCGSGADPDQPTSASTSASPTPTPEAVAPSPSVTVTSELPTAAPAQLVTAGAVAEDAPAQAAGVGSATVTYTRGGEFAVVIVLDCTACAGGMSPTVLTGPGRGTPYGEAAGPLAGSYLMDVFQGSDPEQSVWLQADGPWSIRFESWNDLPGTTGPLSGTGSTVLRMFDQGAHAEVTWAPAGPDDDFSGRFFGVGDQQLFGNDEAFTEVVDLPMPGVFAIRTDGTWTVTPQP
ncbi:hypothetical protein ASD16_05175 [Cellulomonas sp. Root485]|uniref:hypothetical protein n=1 Tax=Cellulomonas sp. Root485 TaxID=1736546 RepID=UPI0006F3218A|nr:hypothetical protein [Cellulomonas sp. Root485]KQY24874.1 hypothetical protein ASD16_05175 [Cellulomonas sp. Root485]